MAAPTKLNFKMYQGTTFTEEVRWESSKKSYAAITGITNAAPCVVTASSHGVPDKWRIKISNVQGMTDINSGDEYYIATVLTANTIELNSVNSVGYKVYTTNGIIEYNKPVDLTGFTARMQLRSSIDSATIIAEYTTENGNIIISPSNSSIVISVPANITAGYSFSSAIYGLELISSTGVVTQLTTGTITLIKEVTR